MESDHHAHHGQGSGGPQQQGALTQHNLQQNIHHALAASQHPHNSVNEHGVVLQNTPSSATSSGPTDAANSQQFCLRWNNFQSNIVSSFETLLDCEELVDVTISCDGRSVRAHKILLSACSPYFRDLFQSMPPTHHPVVVLRETRFNELKSLLCFIYHGEVNVSQESLPRLLNLAEALKVKGLAQDSRSDASQFPSHDPSDESARLPNYPPDREDNTPDLSRPNPLREGASPSAVNFSNLSALGSLLNSGKVPRGTPVGFERPSSVQGRNTPYDNASPSQNSSSPPSKRRKRQLSPKSNTSHTTPTNNPSSVSSAENNTSTPPREDAVNLSTTASSSPPPPRLMILKEEIIANDQDAEKEKEQRERISHLLKKERFGMIKIGSGGGYMDSEGEEEPPPPSHEDENSGDMDSHERSGPGLPLSHPLQQSFVPYPPSSLPGHHFANSFTPGSSSALTPSNAPSWRSHSNEQNPNSPQGVHPVFKELLCSPDVGGVGAGVSTNTSGHSGGSVTKKAVPTPCPICNKVLSNAYNMRVHLETHQDITYKCLICAIVTRTRDTMRKHLSNVHKLRNIQLKNSFKKITGKNENEGGGSSFTTPVKTSKSPPPLLTPSQALAAAKSFKSTSSLDQFTPKRDVKSNLKAALTSGLTLTTPNNIPAVTPSSAEISSIASLTTSAINDVTAAAMAALFPSLAANRPIPHPSTAPSSVNTSNSSLFSSALLSDSEATLQGNKLASIVSKLSQNNEMKF